jgi:hypothetical protein
MADVDFTSLPLASVLGASVILLQDNFGSEPALREFWPGHMHGDEARVIEFAIDMDWCPFWRIEFGGIPGGIYDIGLDEFERLFTVAAPSDDVGGARRG